MAGVDSLDRGSARRDSDRYFPCHGGLRTLVSLCERAGAEAAGSRLDGRGSEFNRFGRPSAGRGRFLLFTFCTWFCFGRNRGGFRLKLIGVCIGGCNTDNSGVWICAVCGRCAGKCTCEIESDHQIEKEKKRTKHTRRRFVVSFLLIYGSLFSLPSPCRQQRWYLAYGFLG